MAMKASAILALALALGLAVRGDGAGRGLADATGAADRGLRARRQSRRAGAAAGGQIHRHFGKPFIVENVPGAGGIVAANMVAKGPPDGHVLMFGDSGAMAINPALNPNLGYDPIKDFTPITALVSLPTILVGQSRRAGQHAR